MYDDKSIAQSESSFSAITCQTCLPANIYYMVCCTTMLHDRHGFKSYVQVTTPA